MQYVSTDSSHRSVEFKVWSAFNNYVIYKNGYSRDWRSFKHIFYGKLLSETEEIVNAITNNMRSLKELEEKYKENVMSNVSVESIDPDKCAKLKDSM